MTQKEKIDVLIIGAGPSGTVAAAYLAQKGLNVQVVEKANFPRFSVGESLIPRCMDNFEEAGLLDCLKEQNYQVKSGARFIKDDLIGEFEFSEKFGEGWDWTWQVPRADFDMVLAQECIRKGVKISFETEVVQVEFPEKERPRVIIRKRNRRITEIEADFIIDASGFGRVLAKQLHLEAEPDVPNHSSLFTHVKDIRRPEGYEGTRITFDILERDAWFWYIPFSNGNTSIGFVGPNKWLEQFGTTTSEKMKALLERTKKYKPQFKDLPFLFEPILVKNTAKNATKLFGKNYVLTGNSAKFLDPIFSSGISFGTESGLLAAKLVIKELNGNTVNWQKEYVDHMNFGVEVFSSYVREWYTGNLQELILHPNPNPEIKEQVCSVLAGYVWNKKNPFVRKHDRIIAQVAELIRQEKEVLQKNSSAK